MTSSSGEVEGAVEQVPATEAEVPAAEKPAGEEKKDKRKATKEKKQKAAPKEKKPKTPAHPPYFQMIKEAITSLNEKGGSSPYAIAKYMEEKHKSVLPANFRKTLGLQLKNSVAKGKLIKVKASYKLSESGKRGKSTTRAARANANAAKPITKENNKRKRPRSKAVSMIENMTTATPAAAAPVAALVATTRGRRTKKAAPTKPKQLKSIKSPIAKKARKATA